MGEIKSTLDIIMEKTKGLTMSEEERASFKEKELTGKVKGLVQKYIDGFLSLESLKVEIVALDKDQQGSLKNVLINELIHRINFEGDNGPFLEIMDVFDEIDAAPIMELIADINHALDNEKSNREKERIAQLKEKEISGSAINPNINADPDWVEYKAKKMKEFEEQVRVLSA